MRQKLLSITQSLRLPRICTLCNQFHKGSLAVCSFCSTLITPLNIACHQCAYPLPEGEYLICGQCISKPPHFDQSIIGHVFTEPLRSLLHEFKYHHGFYLAPFLTQLMFNSVQHITPLPECLIPVPMHPQRIRRRGFNQAAILTKLLSKQLGIPYDVMSCKKVKNTAPQASLDGEQRQKNLKNAFSSPSLPYRHVAIVDDLLTTGSTVNELALTLKSAGVSRVDVWCCARAVGSIYK